MRDLDYAHLMLAGCLIYGAVRYTFTQRLFGHSPRWPFVLGGYAMSPVSRWLQFSVYTTWALWEIARALMHLESSLLVTAIAILALVSLGVAYRHDRQVARNNALDGFK